MGGDGVAGDMMDEILLRLPVKTLLRFKSVCRRWFSLIGSRRFADRHQQTNNQGCLIIDPYYNGDLYFSLYPNIHEELRIPFNRAKILHTLGPVKGVFCEVSRDGTIMLSNPATREMKALPRLIPLLSLRLLAYGFGFDPLSGAFKIVVFPFPKIDKSTTHVVYNSTTNSWTHPILHNRLEVGAMPYARWNHEQSRFLNGVYYWLVRFNHGGDYAVLAFDMASEEFRDVMPVPDRDLRFAPLSLAVYGGSLALMSYEVGGYVHLWVMEGKLWKKSFCLGPFRDMAWPLCVWNNTHRNRHEMLLETQSGCHHILCDLSTKAVRNVQLRPPHAPRGVYKVFSYKQTLVSIEGLYTFQV